MIDKLKRSLSLDWNIDISELQNYVNNLKSTFPLDLKTYVSVLQM